MTQDDGKNRDQMELQDIRKLIDMLSKSTLDELELEMGETRLRLSRHQAAAAPPAAPVAIPVAAPPPPQPAAAPPAPSAAAAAEVLAVPAAAPAEAEPEKPAAPPENVTVVTSPMVGTFYRAASPGADPFVKVGDRVTKGQVLCIVEAMKLMNEIEAEQDGVIVDILVENAQPIEYGEALFHLQAGG